jgi:hypothetical protein
MIRFSGTADAVSSEVQFDFDGSTLSQCLPVITS